MTDEFSQRAADVQVLDEVDAEKADAEVSEGAKPNVEGTLYQSQLGEKSTRKHFFSPLDSTVAEAVHKDAEGVQYTEKEELYLYVFVKIARRLRSDAIFYPTVNQFDRTNIGNAHVIAAFNENYGVMNNNKWTLALSLFYIGYCLLEMPANVLQRIIGANRFFFMSLTFWGLASLSFVYAKGYPALLVLRILLGIGEAGYYAGMIYYLSFWYRRRELATRISLCMTGTLPGAIGGLLAFGLVRAHTSVLKGWQFLFLSHGGMNGWQGFKAIVTDINAWLLMAIYATFNVGVATISYFLPTLIKELGFTSIQAQGLTVAPYLVGWFMVFLQAWNSDRIRDRGWHIMASTFISFVGYLILATTVQRSVGASYFALFLVVGGNYSLFPLVMSWAANTFSPTSKRGVGTAFIVSISNCVSIASPQIYFDSEDSYRKGHAISAACLFMSFVCAFILRTRLSTKNKSNKEKVAALEEEGKLEEASGELNDHDPRYVYMT
ncbi:hypothetical protein EW146_g2180 [Bondarzewia mesenterica]|uniref:Major facilitator superfamily (MFS) profile domain-containing protein n=1 Tax=Bondarzewia mesenterica TaxID=1095465 RepID=A0A4V3XFU4_9AGAM|nr:hypothetical protein EW146_g2180 [Bondarzewia mesenterica]